jgi:protoporphyrin/coproporphyrin ferrochelatase
LTPLPFDAVLLVAFGGPLGPDDVHPFLANVLRGRRVTPERIDEVAHHYELFGGVSPLTALTRAQAAGMEERLRARGLPLPVYVGMRNWHPFLSDTLSEMSRAGVRRAVAVIAAAHRSYSSCMQYRENVRDARAALRDARLPDVEVIYIGDWHEQPKFIDASTDRVLQAIQELPPDLQPHASLVFTAHSIPISMSEKYPYRQQYERSAALIAERVREHTGVARKVLTVYQSRSGRPEDPWLGPDICECLRQERAEGMAAAVLCPVGFICDHVEVLYDLDTEAAGVCRDIGLPMVRAKGVNDHPAFVDMLADMVQATVDRYTRARPLQIVPSGV